VRAGAPDGAAGGRPLGALAAGSVVIGVVVGIGIFLTPAEIARGVGAPGWVFVLWALTGAMAAAGALCYGELAARFPAAGGPYVYLRAAYGPRIAFLYGWKCLLVMDPGLSAAVATGAAEYAAYLFGLSPAGAKGFALAVVLGLATLTALGTRLAAGVVVAITALKVAALLGLVGWSFGAGTADLGSLQPLFVRPAGAPPLATGLAAGFVAAFFSFGGWWEASKLAGEVRAPERKLPFVFVGGIAVVTALYLLASAAFLAALPPAGAGAEVTAPLLGERLLGAAGGRVLAAVVLVSAVGTLAAVLLAAPRLYVAMAADGLFPRRLGRRHPRLGTPLGAIAVQASLASLLVAVGTFGQIVTYFLFATVAFIALSVAALFVLPPPPPGAFRAPARRLAAATFVTLAALLLALLLVGQPVSAGLGAAVVLLGVPVYGLLRSRRGRAEPRC
jgi:APA family basic amino acid/polyamine antiporter